jgi:hypothetical protein
VSSKRRVRELEAWFSVDMGIADSLRDLKIKAWAGNARNGIYQLRHVSRFREYSINQVTMAGQSFNCSILVSGDLVRGAENLISTATGSSFCPAQPRLRSDRRAVEEKYLPEADALIKDTVEGADEVQIYPPTPLLRFAQASSCPLDSCS